MTVAILESMQLFGRDGAALTPETVYGRRLSIDTDETSAALVEFQATVEVYDVAWSTDLAAALPIVSKVSKGGITYKLNSYQRRDQRTFRVYLGATR